MSFRYEKHKLYPNLILIREIKGFISLNEMLDSWEYLVNNYLNNHEFSGLINDLTECKLNMDLNDFMKIISSLQKYNKLKNLKIAVVTNNPQTIVFPMLAENKKIELNIKPFSSIEAAEHWILTK